MFIDTYFFGYISNIKKLINKERLMSATPTWEDIFTSIRWEDITKDREYF